MVEYRRNVPLSAEDVVRVFDDSGIARPTGDIQRIERMFANANLVVSAWDEGVLVGICRALTDFSYACYVSDLAVANTYQKRGVGMRLIREVQDAVGEEVSIVLISNPNAVSYYPRIGFSKSETAFVIKRVR